MTLARFWRLRAARHLAVWLVLLGLVGLLSQLEANRAQAAEGIRYALMLLPVLALAIYLHYWLLTNLLERGRYWLYGAATVATILAGGALLDYSNHTVKVRMLAADGRPQAAGSQFGQAVANVLVALVLATMARYLRRGIVSRYQLQALHARQVETELSLLKAQVNQHFLFNTLNNLYGLSLAAPDQMPEALLQLAGLMRYQLDSSRQHTVTVGTEAEYLANYVGLEKLRLRDSAQVEFTADLPYPDQPLPPLLLLPLVENCFKHAPNPAGPTCIRIGLTQTATSLLLHTYNSVPPDFRPPPSGLGLPNLRARLAQFYPGARHRFRTNATATDYAATLQLTW